MIKYCLLIMIIVGVYACNSEHIISRSEKVWLMQHPNLTVGLSPNAPPYQFINDKGEMCGIFIDFLTIIESSLNYKFKKVYQSDFSKLLSDIKTGDVDLLLEVQKTEEREKFLNFTQDLLSHPHVIVVRKSQQGISSIDDLKDRNIAVVNKYAVQEYLTNNFPQLKLNPLFDDVSCLRAVSTGQADAFICQQAVATYYIEAEGISNLKISGSITYENELAIASRKDYEPLNSILSKAVNSISKTEKQKIYNNWLSYTVQPFYFQTRFWIIVAIIILSAFAFVIIFILTLQKIVRQKTNELVIAKEKAEESDRLKTAFLSNMSHEIRTPMNGILGFSALLKEPKLTGEEQEEYINQIEKSGARMLNIINDIVCISQLESGQMELFVTETNINELIENIYCVFNPLANKKGIQLFYKNPLPYVEAVIKTDSEKISTVLTCLVKNAVKFSAKGSIEFGYHCVAAMEHAPLLHAPLLHAPLLHAPLLQFYVKDNGIGVPKDRQKAIFDRFVQADIGDKSALQGAGLGLSISKAYVEMLGGKIWVESDPDGISGETGSSFYFTIPYNCEFDSNKVNSNVDFHVENRNKFKNINIANLL